MIDLNDYYYFVHVVEKKGFSAAAKALNLPKSRLSRHVMQLEQRLNVRLLQRTSRQFHVTEAGRLFYRHARSMVKEMEEAEAALTQATQQLSGRVSLSCSVGIAHFAVRELLTGFVKENPNVSLSQQVTNNPVNLLEVGVDMAIRGHMESLPDSSLIQRHLATVEWGLVASPSYLQVNGWPQAPQDLIKTTAMKVGWQLNDGAWTLKNTQGQETSVPFSPRFCSDDMSTLKHAAIEGLGMVSLPLYTCKSECEQGRLVRVLPDWTTGIAQLSLLMPTRTGLTAPVMTLRDHLLKEFKKAVAP